MLDIPAKAAKRSACDSRPFQWEDAFNGFDNIFKSRIADTDEFYQRITPQSLSEDQRRMHRQALAGMLWGKQFYYFDLEQWLSEHKVIRCLNVPGGCAKHGVVPHAQCRRDLDAGQVGIPVVCGLGMAFHTVALSMVDFDFAKEQLLLLLRNLYFHPNGQIPAYEWNFSDVNPPVHAWATLWLFKYERTLGRTDFPFPRTVISRIDAQLQLVGEPQRSYRAQRFCRWLSWFG